MIKLTIPGKPIAKKRPRFYRRGKGVGTYNDQGTEEGRFLFEVKNQIHPHTAYLLPLKGPLQLHCEFCMYIPKSTSKKKQVEMIIGQIRHTKKPDLDNLIKFVLDCLNGIAWNDDSQVTYLSAVKHYSETPRTVVIITGADLQPPG